MEGHKVTGWLGWVFFAGILMMLAGVFESIVGLLAIFNDAIFTQVGSKVVLIDITQWGWVHLIVGLILFFTAFSLMAGQSWGRVVAVILATLSAIANFAFIHTYPVWSIVVIIVDVLVIYAVVVHGAEAKMAQKQNSH